MISLHEHLSSEALSDKFISAIFFSAKDFFSLIPFMRDGTFSINIFVYSLTGDVNISSDVPFSTIVPSFITAILSHNFLARLRSCVINIMLFFFLLLMSDNSLII